MEPLVLRSFSCVLVILLLSLGLQVGANKMYNYITEEGEINAIPGEFFPYCVDVIDIWPPPNSVLRPVYLQYKYPGRAHYLFRVTFSRPVAISHNDTSAGWQPEIAKLPIKGGWLWAPKGKLPNALFKLDKVAPVFLTPSQTSVKRYYASRVVNWHGSSREFLFYFTIPAKEQGPNLRLSQKVYLVVDGGRFYTFGKVGPARHPVFAPTTIIGEYYFDEYIKNNTWFKPKPQTLFKPSPYCKQREPRPFSVSQDLEEDEKTVGNFSVCLNEGDHLLETKDYMVQKQHLSLNLSLSMNGVGGTATLSLPSVVKAQCRGVNVTVKLPDSLTATVKQPLTAPKIFVPVKRSPIYELRERIYHNGRKVMIMGIPPAFIFTDFIDDKLDGAFPKKIITTNKYTDINMEVVDKGTGVRLAQYFVFWEYFEDYQIDVDFLPKMVWLEVTRNAPIAAKTDTVRYRRAFVKNQIRKITTPAKFLSNNSRICPVGSIRNPGRRGGTIDHVIEYGPLYHLLEPLPTDTWTVDDVNVEITVTNDKGIKVPVSVLSTHPGVDKNIPSSILEGVQKYRCLLSPLKDIPKPKLSNVVNEKWVHLDSCVFVPTSIANSKQCSGLQMFQNVSSVVSEPEFCSKEFGDCIGLPFSSLERFPAIPTFGLRELTGWIPCPSEKCPLNTHQEHPIGRHFIQSEKIKAMPKSILKFSKTRETPVSSHDDIVMELSPSMNSESRIDYTLVLTGVEILEPKLSSYPEDLTNHNSVSLTPKDCTTIWQLHSEPLTLSNTHTSDARLIATVYNNGEGGGDFLFDVRCTAQLTVHPSTGVIRVWIEPLSSATVTFTLGGELAVSVPNKNHKCELAIKLQASLGTDGDDGTLLVCSRWITTYYGAFEEPCHLRGDLPFVDLAYYVLPRSQIEESPSVQHFLDSPIGDYLDLVRVITVSMNVPHEERHLLKMLDEIRISCQSRSVVVLQERQLLREAVLSVQNISVDHSHHPVIISGDLTANRRVYFFTTRSWIESQSSHAPDTSSCEMVLTAYSPNWICKRTHKVVEKVHVPLVKADIEAIMTAGSFSFLYPIFGRQSDPVMISLCLCVVIGLLSAVMVSSGCAILFVFRKRLPKRGTLMSLRGDLDKAKKEDKTYWENPQMYLCSAATVSQANPDSCVYYEEEHYGPHFILHQWRATDSMDINENIKHLKIAGTLKYKTQELPVMFGHVKKIYLHKDGSSGNVWLQASSGMYLLLLSTVTLDYLPTLVQFFKRQGVEESKYKEYVEKIEPPGTSCEGEEKVKTGGAEEVDKKEGFREDDRKGIELLGADSDIEFGNENDPLLL